ncbi:MAG: HEAT repeat domain-containing protein [Deltaproteobacteria bacterium]|nr:HEAT repeat domain-containing protein [Deltaproteobacteria bacterium]
MNDEEGMPLEIDVEMEPEGGLPEASDDGAAQIKDFFSKLRKGWKSISMYRHDTARFLDFVKPALESLDLYFATREMLSLSVDEARFRMGEHPVYEEELSDQNLAFRFYREGVRLLIFRSGLELEELLDFSMVCTGGARPDADTDLVGQLWEKEFGHIEYVVVDSFSVSGESDEQAKVEVEKILAYLHQGLSSKNAEVFNIARLNLDDLEAQLDDVTQAVGMNVKEEIATEHQKKTLLEELNADEELLLLPRFIELMVLLLQYPMEEDLRLALEDIAYQMLDAALLEADLDRIVRLVDSLKALMGQSLLDECKQLVQKVGQGLLARMGDAERISRIGDILESANPQTVDAVRRYLDLLGEDALGPLLDVLEKLTRKDARDLIAHQLVRLGAGHLEKFVRRLDGANPNLVRDLLGIIEVLNPPDKLAIIGQLLTHQNMMIRLEAVRSIGETGDRSCKEHIMRAFGDKDAQVRVVAARYLPTFAPSESGALLRARIDHPGFEELSPREQSTLFAAYSHSIGPEAVSFFRGKLRETSLFNKKQLQEQKRSLVSTLALSGSLVGLQVIEGELKAGVKDKEMEAYMKRALAKARVKVSEAKGAGGMPEEESHG